MIDDLLNSVNSGARRNKYRVLIPIIDKELSREVSILCHASSLPGRTLVPTEVVIKGRKVQMRGETSFDGSWEMTVYNTENMKIRQYFLDWMQQVHNTHINPTGLVGTIPGAESFVNQANNVVGAAKGVAQTINNIGSNPLALINAQPAYQRDIKIEQLNSRGEVEAEVLLIGAFPTAVAAVDLDDATGEVSTSTITFAYSDMQTGSLEENAMKSIFGDNATSFI